MQFKWLLTRVLKLWAVGAFVAGVALMAGGAALIYPPAGLILLGTGLLAIAISEAYS